MDRVFESGAAVAAPTVPSSPSTGYPTSGNPATGTPATKPGPYWFYQVTEEIRNAIVAADLTPSSASVNQLSTAISMIASKKSIVGSMRNGRMSIPTASSTATFTADQIIVQASLSGASYQLSSFSKSINLGATGAGGMDTGSAPANGIVSLYAIYNPTTGVSSILAVSTTSTLAPEIYGGSNMPSGYTASALISTVRTNSSGQFVACNQFDRLVAFANKQVFTINNDVYVSISGSISLAGVVPVNAYSLFGNVRMASLGGTTNFGFSFSGVNTVGISGYDNYASASYSDLCMSTPQTLTYNIGTGSSPVSVSLDINGYRF